MSKLNVIDHEGQLVVDSRLIALELGIQHKNFLANLDKYLEEIEEDWGQVAFETETVTNSVGASNSVKYALLTEPQATLLMTYSRNTEQVRRCKRQLVKAFTKAKQALSNAVELRVLELEQKLASQSEAIAKLQSQIQNLLPLRADFIPPGWDVDVWATLPPQDKRHFKYLYRSRGFRPGSEAEVKALPAANRASQLAEIEHLINDVPEEEKELLETAKRVALQRFWAKGGES